MSEPMDCSLPGSSVPGISQARVLEPSPNAHLLIHKAKYFSFFQIALVNGMICNLGTIYLDAVNEKIKVGM